MPENYIIKPNKAAFFTFRFFFSFLAFSLFFAIVYLFIRNLFPYSGLIIGAIFLFFTLFSYINLSIKYQKERYIFMPSKIVRKGGGIFSDFEIELYFQNITHINMRLPFIENLLFKTGNIRIESAGSGSTEIYLSCIDHPDAIYKYTEDLMKYNGFKLEKSKIISKERPSSLGVFFEVFSTFFGTIGFIVFMVLYMGEPVYKFLLTKMSFLLPISGFIIFILLIRAIFQFIDLKSREYIIYSDAITYSEGFLTKNYALIPMENLADSTVTQTLIDKIFGLYDVKVSCQGSNQEILFKNIVNGQKLENTIDSLIQKSSPLAGKSRKEKAEEKKEIKEEKSSLKIAKDTSFNAEYKMDMAKTIVPLLFLLPVCIILLPFLLFWIIYFVSSLINASFTTYFVKGNSIQYKFNFLNKKDMEFSNDKITGVVIRENIIDWIFKTCSIQFMSIGSSETITFSNIKKHEGLYESILAKFGMADKESVYAVDSKYAFFEMLKSNLFITIFAILIIPLSILLIKNYYFIPVISIVFIYILAAVYLTIYYKRSKLRYSKGFMHFKRGIFFIENYYALYENIKNIRTTKYPFSKYGTIYYDISGEQIVQSGKNRTVVSNSFSINYVKDIGIKNTLLDLIFVNKPDSKEIESMEKNISKFIEKPIIYSKPDLGNTLFPLILISVIIFPLILLLPLTIPLAVLSLKATSYSIEKNRVTKKYGIFYKNQVSILFRKIDHVNSGQGMINKMFGNGNITVNTLGSSSAEMIISDIRNYNEFYEQLKKMY